MRSSLRLSVSPASTLPARASADGGGHQQHVGAREVLLAGRGELGGGRDVDVVDAEGGAGQLKSVGGDDGHARAAAGGLLGAQPILPDERLPTKRTASIGSRVPPAVTRTWAPSKATPRRCAQVRVDRGEQVGGLGQRPMPHSPGEPSAPVPGSA